MKQIILTILIASILTGCDFISTTLKYKDTTEDFIETLIKKDYNKCVELMAMNHELAENTNIDTMKSGLANFRKVLVTNWGTELEYSFMTAEKKFSTTKTDNIPPNTTLVLVQISNKKDFGILQVLFDDRLFKKDFKYKGTRRKSASSINDIILIIRDASHWCCYV